VERIEALNLFSDGWERLRERIFANQQRLGVIPANAQLAPWPDFLQRWESLSEGEKRLFIRQANVYAAYLANTDHQIGRVIAEVERWGQLDNTLIICVSGDNGSSAEGCCRNPTAVRWARLRAAALRALDSLPPANRLHAARLLEDATRLVRIEAARALASVPLSAMPAAARPAFARAWEELLASERVAAERPEAQVNIAGLLAARGDQVGAEAAYRAALARDAAFLPALVNLAGFEEARGRMEPALSLLRQAVMAHPDAADAHFALALFHVRRGEVAQSLETLAASARLAPEEPRYRFIPTRLDTDTCP
jgi:tetratricopeptide (TPR) repeat protein